MKKAIRKITALFICALCLLTLASAELESAKAAKNYEKDIFYFLKNEMGMNDASACGIVANIEKESSFRPDLYGDEGTSYGICQWHNDRFDALKKFCADEGYDYKSITGQLFYLKYELEKSYPNTLKDIKGVENTEEGAYYAAYSFCYNFEKPANREVKAEQRGELAKEYWKKYGVLADITPQKITSPSDGKTVSSASSLQIKWTAGEGDYTRNRLHVVKSYGGNSYDWDSEQIEVINLNTLSYTFNAGELSDGTYLIWVEPWNHTDKKAGPASDAITVTVYDELFCEAETDIDGAVFDAEVEESVDISGWAIETGRGKVDVSYSFDGAEYEPAEKRERSDIALSEEYGMYCPDELVGFEINLPLADLSNGEHSVIVKAQGDSVTETVAEYTFAVINGHDHSFTDYVSNKDATYLSDGTKTAKCDSCNTKNTVTDEGSKKLLGVAKSFTASSKDTSTVLTWKSVKGATYYRVYIYSSGWKLLEETEECTYTVTDLKASKKYRFAVKACYKDETGSVMAPSYVSLSTITRPSNLKTLSATVTSNSVTLKWNKAEGATGYRVFLYNNTTKKWDVAVRSTHKTSAVIKGLESAKTYKYAVRPYYNSGEGIIWSAKYLTKTVTAKLKTPTIMAARSSAKERVTLSWSKSSLADGYQIWVSESKSGGYKKISNYKIRSLYLYNYESGETYYFKVRAYKKIDGGYVYSDYTDVQTIKIK